MFSRSAQTRLRKILVWTWRSSVAMTGLWFLIAAVLRWDRTIRAADDVRAQILLTLFGIIFATWLGKVLIDASRIFMKTAMTGLAALAVSQACYYLLVWTELKAHHALWRVWWIPMIATIAAAHVMWLRVVSAGRRGAVEKIAITAAVATAALVASIVLGKDLLANPPTWLIAAIAFTGLISVTGSFVAFTRVRKNQPYKPPPLWRRFAITAAVLAIVFGTGFYLGRVTTPVMSALDLIPSTLAQTPPDELERQVNDDLARLKIITAGIDELQDKSSALSLELKNRREKERRDYYRPEEDDRVRGQFMSYLAYRAALLRMVATYAGFQSVTDPQLRAQCFLVGYGAGTTVVDASYQLVSRYRDDSVARSKLNEPDAAWGMPAGMFDRIEESLASEKNISTFEEMAAYFQTRREQWQSESVLPAEQFSWLDARIAQNIASVRRGNLSHDSGYFDRLLRKVKNDAYSPVYATQSIVSSWIGDTKLVRRPPLITHRQIEQMREQLRPGDILLERRNWFFSNAFLPGFWPHAALYVGSIDDLEKIGLVKKIDGRWTSDDPAVRDRLEQYLARAGDGGEHTVIESVSEGVIFNSLSESMHADFVAVLRPSRLTDAQKARAIAKAFSHQGKPYDFDFDFSTSDKLVCTELVYRSYESMLDFPMSRIMGKSVLPALNICKKFADERHDAGRQLDFVLFLDGKPAASEAVMGSVEDFCASAKRSRGFNE